MELQKKKRNSFRAEHGKKKIKNAFTKLPPIKSVLITLESFTIENPSGTNENNKIVYSKIDSMISKESVVALKNNRMLSDDIINVLQNMLNREYPDVKGLQDPVLGHYNLM